MKKYYYNNFLICKSKNEYAYAVGCVIDNKFKVFGCYRNYNLATKRFIETKRMLEKNYKLWSSPVAIACFGNDACDKIFYNIKFQFDNLMLIKLEANDV